MVMYRPTTGFSKDARNFDGRLLKRLTEHFMLASVYAQIFSNIV